MGHLRSSAARGPEQRLKRKLSGRGVILYSQKHNKTYTKESRNYSMPWLNMNSLKLMKKRDLALKIALKTKQYNDKLRFTTLNSKVVQRLRGWLFLEGIGEGKGNVKLLWEQIKKLTGHHKVGKQIETFHGTLSTLLRLSTIISFIQWPLLFSVSQALHPISPSLNIAEPPKRYSWGRCTKINQCS